MHKKIDRISKIIEIPKNLILSTGSAVLSVNRKGIMNNIPITKMDLAALLFLIIDSIINVLKLYQVICNRLFFIPFPICT